MARRRSPPLGATTLAALLALGGLGAGGTAHAFCRSTTCAGDCPRDADGCKTSGAPLYWPGLCVGFSLQRDGSEHIDLEEIRHVVNNAFVAWADVQCEGGFATLAFSPMQDAACHKAEYDPGGSNANIILFQDHRWEYTDINNTLAKTTVTYDTDTGEIFDADIELNHAYNVFTTGDDEVVYDLQSIVTHEAGHFLGLDHTLDFAATMNASYELGTTALRDIEPDDREGLCAIYPPSRDVQCNATPRGGFASACSGVEPEEGCAVAPASKDRRDEPRDAGHLALVALAAALATRHRARSGDPRATGGDHA